MLAPLRCNPEKAVSVKARAQLLLLIRLSLTTAPRPFVAGSSASTMLGDIDVGNATEQWPKFLLAWLNAAERFGDARALRGVRELANRPALNISKQPVESLRAGFFRWVVGSGAEL